MAIEATYYVWITALSDNFTEQIVGRLIRRNWKVGALGNLLSLHNDENLATMIAVSVSKVPIDDEKENEITISVVIDDIKDILKRLKINYYSLVVSRGTGCTWCLGNVTKAVVEEENFEQKKGVN